VCQLEALRSCLKPKMATIKQKLDDLPRTLDGTYERIFKEMSPDYEREMRTILMLLAFSTRPMTIQEVAEATAVNLEDQAFSIEDRFPDPYDLLELCSSLVSVVDLGSDAGSALKKERGFIGLSSWKPEIKVLQFAHFSVKEYILSERAQKITTMELQIEHFLCQRQITEICLIYLLDFSEGQAIQGQWGKQHDDFPFLAYAALHWTRHMSSVPAVEKSSIEGLLIRLFDPDQPHCLMNFLNVYDPAKTWHLYDEGPTIRTFGYEVKRNKQDFETPLYYASYYGLGPIVTWLLGENTNSESERERLGSALGAAAGEGHIDLARMLLDRGADPNTPYCAKFHSPLHAAADGGHSRMVKLLLNAGADVKAHGGEYGTALHIAAKKGNPEVAKLLIDAGHDLETRVDRYGKPISLAAQHENPEALKVLISSGAEINSYAGGYYDPLVMASLYSSIDSVRILLDAGAEPNWPSSDASPLQNAAKRADLDIMRLLIARGADINGPGGTYGTPLKGAIQSHEMASFELILDSGADLNALGSRAEYPVGQAIFGGNVAAAEKLLELGAKFDDNALFEALSYHTN
jgi:ankyrin repeat protein